MFIRYKDRYAEYILYIVFGILTTIVNFITYFIFIKVMGFTTVTSNLIATAISIIFAYITNKIFVFNSKRNSIGELIRELIEFICARIFTGLLDTLFVFIGVDCIKANDFVIKTISCIIVVLLNYIISKAIIFNKQEDSKVKQQLGIEMPEIIWHDRKRIFCGLPWTFTKYSLTKDRLFIETGLFNYKQNETRLYRILDLQLTRSFIQRIFGLGTIKICSSDKALGNFDIKNIKFSSNVKELLSVNIEEQRQKNRVSSREFMNGTDIYEDNDTNEVD